MDYLRSPAVKPPERGSVAHHTEFSNMDATWHNMTQANHVLRKGPICVQTQTIYTILYSVVYHIFLRNRLYNLNCGLQYPDQAPSAWKHSLLFGWGVAKPRASSRGNSLKSSKIGIEKPWEAEKMGEWRQLGRVKDASLCSLHVYFVIQHLYISLYLPIFSSQSVSFCQMLQHPINPRNTCWSG